MPNWRRMLQTPSTSPTPVRLKDCRSELTLSPTSSSFRFLGAATGMFQVRRAYIGSGHHDIIRRSTRASSLSAARLLDVERKQQDSITRQAIEEAQPSNPKPTSSAVSILPMQKHIAPFGLMRSCPNSRLRSISTRWVPCRRQQGKPHHSADRTTHSGQRHYSTSKFVHFVTTSSASWIWYHCLRQQPDHPSAPT